MRALLLIPLLVLAANPLRAEQRKDLPKVTPTLDWHREPAAAYAESKKTGRPILLVFR